jgi:hypothetical protein
VAALDQPRAGPPVLVAGAGDQRERRDLERGLGLAHRGSEIPEALGGVLCLAARQPAVDGGAVDARVGGRLFHVGAGAQRLADALLDVGAAPVELSAVVHCAEVCADGRFALAAPAALVFAVHLAAIAGATIHASCDTANACARVTVPG